MNAIERYRLRGLTDDQRLEYDERVAICTIDGDVPEAAAKEIAWAQVRPTSPVPPRGRSGPPKPTVRSPWAPRTRRGPTRGHGANRPGHAGCYSIG
jgi:hypothetical protein